MNPTMLDRVLAESVTRLVVFLPRLGLAVLVLLGFWLGASMLSRLLSLAVRRREVDADIVDLLGKIARVAIWLLGTVTALGTVGLNVTALVAGLGLTGFALGFALKDIVSNALAGLLTLIYKPFHHGDEISVSGSEGRVTRIDLRYTVLESDTAVYLVPNSTLFTNSIKVNGRTAPPAATGRDQANA